MKKLIIAGIALLSLLAPILFLTACGGNGDTTLRELPTQPAYVAEFEAEVFRLTNLERTNNGLSAFQLNTALSGSARDHSIDMARGGFMSHTGSDGTSARQRIEAVNLNTANDVWRWGENVARGQRTPEAVVASWMNSTGHRANILSPYFTHLGVGFAYFAGDIMPTYWTQKFIRIGQMPS